MAIALIVIFFVFGCASDKERNGYVQDGQLRATYNEEFLNLDTTTESVLGRIWELANRHTEARELTLRVIFQKKNKYGETIEHDLGNLVVTNIDEVRRYKSSDDYASAIDPPPGKMELLELLLEKDYL
jgi:hypothetical protein